MEFFTQRTCGVIWAVLLLMVMIVTLAVPWYYTRQEFHEQNCRQETMIHWRDAYCHDNCPENFILGSCKHSTRNWRSTCEDTIEKVPYVSCGSESYVYSVSLGLAIASMVMAAVSSVWFVVRAYSSKPVMLTTSLSGISFSDYRRQVLAHTLITLVGFGCLLGAVLYFALTFPSALDHDNGGFVFFSLPTVPCGVLNLGNSDNPCKSFFGSASNPNGYPVHSSWGGAGWISAVVGLLFYTILLGFIMYDYVYPMTTYDAYSSYNRITIVDGQQPFYDSTNSGASGLRS